MAQTERKVRRTLHFRFTMPSGDPAQLLSFVNASKPFYEMFGGTEVRLMQNVDDPGKFIQVIEYEAPESMEINRQRIASDAGCRPTCWPGAPCCRAASRSMSSRM